MSSPRPVKRDPRERRIHDVMIPVDLGFCPRDQIGRKFRRVVIEIRRCCTDVLARLEGRSRREREDSVAECVCRESRRPDECLPLPESGCIGSGIREHLDCQRCTGPAYDRTPYNRRFGDCDIQKRIILTGVNCIRTCRIGLRPGVMGRNPVWRDSIPVEDSISSSVDSELQVSKYRVREYRISQRRGNFN